MNQQTFLDIYQNQLTPKQKQVLHLFLDGCSDEQIVQNLGANHRTTAINHLKNICRRFDILPEEKPDYRESLVQLFIKHKSELVSDRILRNQGEDLLLPPFPEKPESSNSRFYIERTAIESRCYRLLDNPGALIRIKAAKKMGKTSLLKRLMAHATEQGYYTVKIDFSLIETSKFKDEISFLSSFCSLIFQELSQEDMYKSWDSNTPIMMSCTYQVQALLKNLDKPLILGLDDVDKVLPYSELSENFFPMLRYWYEKATESETWEKLRLVVAYSTENYGKLDINRSPFNVGFPIKLEEFSREQGQVLVLRHGLDSRILEPLMDLLGGHPYLLRLALYYLASQDLSLKNLLRQAHTNTGIYQQYLLRLLENLENNQELKAVFKEIIQQQNTTKMNKKTIQIYQLESMGLVKLKGDLVEVSCELYRLYFQDRL